MVLLLRPDRNRLPQAATTARVYDSTRSTYPSHPLLLGRVLHSADASRPRPLLRVLRVVTMLRMLRGMR